MKINVNYDLLEEAAVARCGFSVKRCSRDAERRILFFSAILIPIFCSAKIPTKDVIYCCSSIGLQATVLDFLFPIAMKSISRQEAIENLTQLSNKLKDIFVDTDCEKLQEAKLYKTEYDVDFESFIFPKIMQKKYIMVPVHNEWDNNERSLMQEHYIGTRDYALSYGEPEKKKIFSYGTKRMMQR